MSETSAVAGREQLVPVAGGVVWAGDTGGDGPALVLLHSGWGDSSIWRPMLAHLVPHFRVIRYDARGFGRSQPPRAPFRPLDDLRSVLDYFRVTEAVIVGYSGGAGPAAGLALADPGRVRGLLLLAPGVQDYPWPAADPYGVAFGKLFDAGDREGIVALATRTWAAAGADPAAVAQIRAAAGSYFRLGSFEQPDPPVYLRLGEITAPTVVVTGDRDYPMVIEAAAAIAGRIPGAQTVTAPGADHMLPLRLPGPLAELAGRLQSGEPLPAQLP